MVVAGCSDDGFSAPERDVSFAEVLDQTFVSQALSLGAERYQTAADQVEAASVYDLGSPDDYLFDPGGGKPNPGLTSAVVVCAWADAAADGDLDDDVAAPFLEQTSADGCAGLDQESLSVAVGRLMPGTIDTDAERAQLADQLVIEVGIYRLLTPEIAENVVG